VQKTKKFKEHLRTAFFTGIIVGFALQKAQVSAQTEAQRVVCCVNDGSKTDSYLLAFGLAGKEYKLGTKK
jgi:basic membrane lipoprotein Med (substrate-binding protein (PBP1-ABC) superfamily)